MTVRAARILTNDHGWRGGIGQYDRYGNRVHVHVYGRTLALTVDDVEFGTLTGADFTPDEVPA